MYSLQFYKKDKLIDEGHYLIYLSIPHLFQLPVSKCYQHELDNPREQLQKYPRLVLRSVLWCSEWREPHILTY